MRCRLLQSSDSLCCKGVIVAKSVVVATDFSEGADEAVRQADERARSTGATLTVFNVIANPLRTDPLFPQFRQEMADASPTLQRDVSEQVNERVTALTGRRYDFRSQVRGSFVVLHVRVLSVKQSPGRGGANTADG